VADVVEKKLFCDCQYEAEVVEKELAAVTNPMSLTNCESARVVDAETTPLAFARRKPEPVPTMRFEEEAVEAKDSPEAEMLVVEALPKIVFPVKVFDPAKVLFWLMKFEAEVVEKALPVFCERKYEAEDVEKRSVTLFQ
jgi:hypothetical protein